MFFGSVHYRRFVLTDGSDETLIALRDPDSAIDGASCLAPSDQD